jgi:hypothetical protein
MLLIARSLGGDYVSGISSIPVITHARASPFFSLKEKVQRFLKLTDCNFLGFREQGRTVDSSTYLHIFHQNIRGLRSKIYELVNSFEIDNINPHILRFSGRTTYCTSLYQVIY